jgi:hypothetical protein
VATSPIAETNILATSAASSIPALNTAGSGTGVGPGLASTGTPTAGLVGAAAVLMVAGAGAVYVARTRRWFGHRH